MITCGVDIIKIDRIKEMEKRKDKIFTPNELKYFENLLNPYESMAGTFAAKEAFAKCFGKGLEFIKFQEVEILHTELHAPYFAFYGNTKKEIEENNLNFSLSISHDGDYAIAFVIKNIIDQ